MLQEILSDIQKERDEILGRAQGAKLFLELADPKRLVRASEILKTDRVRITGESPDGVAGTCRSSSGGESLYLVSFRVRGIRVRGATCSCQDSGNSSCKHVLALCGKWLLEQKRLWEKLGEAQKILQPDQLQPNQLQPTTEAA